MAESALQVMLVEDNPADARLVDLALRTGPAWVPIELRHFTRMQPALEVLRQGKTEVLLLDLSLPDDHGAAAVRHALEAAPRTLILVLTGSSDPAVRRQALEAGAMTVVTKHVFAPGELQEVLREMAPWRVLGRQPGNSPARGGCPRSGAPSVPPTESLNPALDPIALANLRSLAEPGLEEELVRSVASVFYIESELLGPRLKKAIARGDAQDARAAAHAFRSTAAYMGAWELTELADKIERLALGGSLEAISGLLGELDFARARATEQLDQVCPRLLERAPHSEGPSPEG